MIKERSARKPNLLSAHFAAVHPLQLTIDLLVMVAVDTNDDSLAATQLQRLNFTDFLVQIFNVKLFHEVQCFS
jgi:hypothetical protein